MRRVAFITAFLAVAVAALLLGPAQPGSGAETGTPAAASHGIIGSWRLTTVTPFGASQSLITFMADGTLLFTDRPVSPADAGFPVSFISTGHGAWEQTGPDTAAATWVEFVSDGEGQYLGTVTDSVEATLSADGTSWSGPFSASVGDPGGNTLFVGGGTVEATRITVQPLASPTAGMPAA